MTGLTRRSLAVMLLGALMGASRSHRVSAAGDPAHTLDAMLAALQGQGTISFSADMDFGASAGKTGLRTLGSTVHVVFERAGRLLARYGASGDVYLLSKFGEATVYRPAAGLKSVLKPVKGGSAFAVPGLFLPYLGLLNADVRKSLFGDIRSITPLAQGTPEQPEETDLAAIMSALFTGEIWIRKSDSTPARVIGTFFDGAGGAAESASLTFSNWSAAAVSDDAFGVPDMAKAKDVPLHKLGL